MMQHPRVENFPRFAYFGPCAIILLLAGLSVYARTFMHGFVYDDTPFILANPAIRSFDTILDFFNTGFPLNRVVTFITFAFNYKVYGLYPVGYHIWNFIIHMGATFTVWWLARMLFSYMDVHQKKTDAADDRHQWLAFFIALLFCVHPLQTQAVSYITQRFSSLAALFYLLSVVSYFQFRASTDIRRKLLLCGAFLVAGLLAIMSKEEAVTLPFMLLLVELFFFDGLSRLRSFKGGMILVAVFAGFFILFSALFRSNIVVLTSSLIVSKSHDGDIVGFGTYLLTQAKVFLVFVQLYMWPFGQRFDYDFPAVRSLFDIGFLAGIILAAGLVGVAFRIRRNGPLVSFGVMWGVIAFSANLVPRQDVIWEHKFYLMSFGFILALVMLLNMFIRSPRVLFSFLIVLVVLWGGIAQARNAVWKSDLSLWQDNIKHSPNKMRVNVNLAAAYEKEQRYAEAKEYYRKAVALAPRSADALEQLANFYFNRAEHDNAIAFYERALALDPRRYEAVRFKALSYEKQGDLDKALDVYAEALKNVGMNNEFYVARGDLLLKKSLPAQAAQEYYFVLKFSPGHAGALIGMARIAQLEGDFGAALSYLNKAVNEDPNNEKVFLERALLYLKQGNRPRALADIERAFMLNPYDHGVVVFHNMLKAGGLVK